MVLSGRIRDQTPTYGSPAISGSGVADLDWSSCSMKRQQFSLCLAGADEPFVVIAPVVIARSDSDAAILFIPRQGIASSLPLLAMTMGRNDNWGVPGGQGPGLRPPAIATVLDPQKIGPAQPKIPQFSVAEPIKLLHFAVPGAFRSQECDQAMPLREH
jgi:hypothetical protein